MKHSRGAKIDELDDVTLGHHTVVQLEIPVREAHAMQVIYAIDNLPENAINLRPHHLPGHNHAEQIKRRIFHDLWRRQNLVIF